MPNEAKSSVRGREQQNADKRINEVHCLSENIESLNRVTTLLNRIYSKSLSTHNGFSLMYFISVCCSFRKWRKEVKMSFFPSVSYNALLIEMRFRMHVNYNQRINECIDTIDIHDHWTNGILQNIKLNQKPENRIPIDYNDN